MANSILKTPNGSDSASTYTTDPPRFIDFVSGVRAQSCIGIAQHSQCEDGSQQGQQDEVTRTKGEGISLLDEQEAYLKNER
jgi:hypothetical protein